MNEDPIWANQTTIHPLGVAAVLILGIAMTALPRRYAVIPMLLLACMIPSAQRVVVGGLDFTLLRIMVLFGWIRVVARHEYASLRWIRLDYAMLALAVVSILAMTAREQTLGVFANRLGSNFDAIGMYFLFRFLIRDWRDVRIVTHAFILVSVVVAAAFALEHNTGRNIFSIFGGVREFTVVREGRLRCQGAFSHAILAGCFWAAQLPMVAALWWDGSTRKVLPILGAGCMLLIVIFCASSTPVGGVGVCLLGGGLFFFRKYTRHMRWGFLATLVGLHMVMEAPVWHLFARIDLAGGSTGWHRYHLINEMVKNFDEWWFLGTSSTAHWGHQMFDITNQYVLQGVRGGLLQMVIFIVCMALAFQCVGQLCDVFRSNRRYLVLSWALGVSLLSHAVMFMAVSYFGQTYLAWYLLLAMIGTMGSLVPMLRQQREGVPEGVAEPISARRRSGRPRTARSPGAPEPKANGVPGPSLAGALIKRPGKR